MECHLPLTIYTQYSVQSEERPLQKNNRLIPRPTKTRPMPHLLPSIMRPTAIETMETAISNKLVRLTGEKTSLQVKQFKITWLALNQNNYHAAVPIIPAHPEGQVANLKVKGSNMTRTILIKITVLQQCQIIPAHPWEQVAKLKLSKLKSHTTQGSTIGEKSPEMID